MLASLLSTSFGCKLAAPRDVNCFLIGPQHFWTGHCRVFFKIFSHAAWAQPNLLSRSQWPCSGRWRIRNPVVQALLGENGIAVINNRQMKREGRWSSGHCTAACCNLQLSHCCSSAIVSCLVVVVIIVLSATTQPPNRTKRGPGQVRVIKLMRSLLLKSFVCCGQLPSGFATDSPSLLFLSPPPVYYLLWPLFSFFFLSPSLSLTLFLSFRRYPLHSYYFSLFFSAYTSLCFLLSSLHDFLMYLISLLLVLFLSTYSPFLYLPWSVSVYLLFSHLFLFPCISLSHLLIHLSLSVSVSTISLSIYAFHFPLMWVIHYAPQDQIPLNPLRKPVCSLILHKMIMIMINSTQMT